MSILTRPILEINLNNLLDNYQLLQKISPNAIASAVVKDDAYGLNAEIVAEFLYQKANCRHFFVAHGIEGEKIRKIAPDALIFVLQGIGEDSLDYFQKAKLTPIISCPQQFEFWKQNKIEGIKPIIHIETGLNRLGFRENELEQLSSDDCQAFSFVMSHLACGDAKEHFMNQHQLDNFKRLKNKFFPNLPASLSASDGTFLGKDYQMEMVRLGAAMYGINTAPYRENQMKHVVELMAPVLQIADLPEGEFVGYAATYRANSNRKIAIISIGYGDGLPRSLSNVGKVFFKQDDNIKEARIIGRISMDNVIIDITDIDGLKVGDMAILLSEYHTLDDMGIEAGTISYEILSRLGKNTRFIKKYNS